MLNSDAQEEEEEVHIGPTMACFHVSHSTWLMKRLRAAVKHSPIYLLPSETQSYGEIMLPSYSLFWFCVSVSNLIIVVLPLARSWTAPDLRTLRWTKAFSQSPGLICSSHSALSLLCRWHTSIRLWPTTCLRRWGHPGEGAMGGGGGGEVRWAGGGVGGEGQSQTVPGKPQIKRQPEHNRSIRWG